ncbi:MAG: hypothetical protein HQK75_13265 [Candidatus Magnetomorum sp.]|nr:hypothetical protein [Candidatus Magnetomorum sp.]
MKQLITLIIVILFSCQLNAEQSITTEACYHFSDNETVNMARKTALSLAKEKAVSLSQSYIQSSFEMNNGLVSKNEISSISEAFIKNTEVIDRKENLDKREVCVKINAVIAIPSKEQLKRVPSPQNKYTPGIKKENHQNFPKNKFVEILDVKIKENILTATAMCHKRSLYHNILLTWYDQGIPIDSSKKIFHCEGRKKVKRIDVELPDSFKKTMTYDIELDIPR